MANSPIKFGSAPGRTALLLALLVSATPALDLLLRAKLLLVAAMVARQGRPRMRPDGRGHPSPLGPL